jgi:hypothetical protein
MDTGLGRMVESGVEIKVFWFFSSEKNILTYLFHFNALPAAEG